MIWIVILLAMIFYVIPAIGALTIIRKLNKGRANRDDYDDFITSLLMIFFPAFNIGICAVELWSSMVEKNYRWMSILTFISDAIGTFLGYGPREDR